MATDIWVGTTDGDWATATNWSLGTVPVPADDVVIGSQYTTALTASDASGTNLTSLTIGKGYGDTLGSIAVGLDITAMQIAATTVNLACSNVTYMDVKDNGTTEVNITKAAASPGTGLYGLHLTSTDACEELNVNLDNAQSLGVAALSGTTANFTVVNIDGEGTVTLGSGLTCPTVKIGGTGTVYLYPAVSTALTVVGSPTVYLMGTGTIAALNMHGGTVVPMSTMTITLLSVFGGTFDGTQTGKGYTVSECKRYGGTVDDSDQRGTWTDGADNYGSDDGGIKFGSNINVKPSAIA